VKLENDEFTIGKYMLDWFEVTKQQMLDLHKQVKAIPEEELAATT
jgi:hypothetical protein